MNPVVEVFRRSCKQTHPWLMRPGTLSDDRNSSYTPLLAVAAVQGVLGSTAKEKKKKVFLFFFYLSANKLTDTYVGQRES